MSAFIVSATHVDVLLSVALHGSSDSAGSSREWSPPHLEEPGRPLSAVTCSVLGAALLAECIAAVSRGNPGCPMRELPGPWPMPIPEQYEFTDFGPCANVAEACKAIDCFEYQSCDHPEWAQSLARRFCDRLRRALIAALAGHEEAPWEWTPETLAARGLIASAAALYVSRGGERGR